MTLTILVALVVVIKKTNQLLYLLQLLQLKIDET